MTARSRQPGTARSLLEEVDTVLYDTIAFYNSGTEEHPIESLDDDDRNLVEQIAEKVHAFLAQPDGPQPMDRCAERLDAIDRQLDANQVMLDRAQATLERLQALLRAQQPEGGAEGEGRA